MLKVLRICDCHFRAILVISVIAAISLSSPASADELTPQPVHSRSGQVVGELLARYHYRDQAINDVLSNSVYTAYFDTLDPQRFYFLASDLAEFSERRDQLDDELAEGRLDTAFAIFKRYRNRVAERTDHALTVLDEGLNFTGDATLELDREQAQWAADPQALDSLWEKRVINDALSQRLNGRAMDEIMESLRGRYERLSRTLEQYTAEDVFQAYMSAWAGEFDPHSSYMSPRTSENFDINMRLSLEGIGALLSSEGDFVEIVELIAGGPAAGSGKIQAGDRIVGVGQTEDDIQDVVGWRLGDVVEQIRGPKGSEVYLRILPASGSGEARERLVTLTRNTIELEEQAAQADVREIDTEAGVTRIGVITLPAFYADFNAANAGDEDYRSTTRDVRRLLEGKTLADIDGLVIDLRGNAGGSLEEAVSLTGLFVDQGPVVQVHRSNGQREVLTDNNNDPALYRGPLGVMVDSRSASASEIFAAAMQDYGRGVVMGDQTFGKGTVQTLIGLDRFGVGNEQTPSGRLKLTIAKFYRINGESTQLKGVTPDLFMPYPQGDARMSERGAENALPWDTIRSARYQRLHNLDGHLSELRQAHQQRLNSKPALQSVRAEAKRIEAEQARTKVSLNEAVRRAEIEQAEAHRLAAVNAQLIAYGREPIESLDTIEPDTLPDVLLDEAAAVMADWVAIQAKVKTLAANH